MSRFSILLVAALALAAASAAVYAAGGDEKLPPSHLVASTVDPATGFRTDTYVKHLGSLTPGGVINTRRKGAAGRLARPAPNTSIVILRLNFDIINADTNQSLPLVGLYKLNCVGPYSLKAPGFNP